MRSICAFALSQAQGHLEVIKQFGRFPTAMPC